MNFFLVSQCLGTNFEHRMPEATQTNKVACTDSHACEGAQESGPNRSQISSCAAGICLHLAVLQLVGFELKEVYGHHILLLCVIKSCLRGSRWS
jgi:hypothetical protein